tara:strand:- start:382 stop:1245 length:864 start_codon:yes stop_codon:yes gene_type:complete
MIKNNFLFSPAGKIEKKELDQINNDLDNFIKLTNSIGPFDRHKIHLLIPSIYELANNNNILKNVENFVNAKCLMWYSVLFNKEKKTNLHIPWHYDDYFWNLKGKGCTVWVALNNITNEMGPMEFAFDENIENLKHDVNQDPNNILVRGNTSDYSPGANIQTETVTLDAGEYSIHSNNVMHRSGVNKTSIDRRAFALRYIDIEAKPLSLKFFKRGVVSKYELPSQFFLEKKPNKIYKSLSNKEHFFSVIQSSIITFFGDQKRSIYKKFIDFIKFIFSKKIFKIFKIKK